MDIKAIVMGLVFALIWSSAFTSARIIVLQAPPLTISALRFLIAGLLCMGIAYLMGQRIRFDRKNWGAVAIFGICQNALYLGLFFMAMQQIEASLASIIASAVPLIVGLVSALQGERVGWLGWTGLCTGFAGVALIMGARLSGGVDLLGILLCLIGVTALAIATLAVRSTSSKGNVLMVVGVQMMIGSAALAFPALLLEEHSFVWTGSLVGAFAYTVIMPGIVATMIWFMLVERIGATRASTFHFLNPFFGVLIAALILNETLSRTDVIGVVIVMAGILAVQSSRAVARPPR
ncbi:DMT family transporter [Neptunicoccus cionae]|uniref:Peptide ABC transporter permease n=1 Tax=Neptunicoccus cionae TaxID=2035344 RepID=A0A916QVL6_9RHOB|nr:DMT family transporter [Amylibacter cionae]GGA16564.1 peptide ABC transporter permease [Amylibacter cionae]